MDKKFAIISLLFLIGCGNNVSISTKELKSNSSLSDGSKDATNQEGVLKRGSPDMIFVGTPSYKVSIYSSYSALEFVAIRDLNSETPVKFRGKIKGNEIVLEFVEAK
jgi:hypothetical protein